MDKMVVVLRLMLFLRMISVFELGSPEVVDKVNVSLYYESLCPFCANFIVNKLGKLVFQTDLNSIVNLNLVPWGNTQFAPNHAWICQHGADECIIDTVEACAINMLPQQGLRFKLIECMEQLHLQGRHGEWPSCIHSLKINPKLMMSCYQTSMGVHLELKYADETNNLNPPHKFVPWVLVNNKPLQEDYNNFVAYICKAYKGVKKPKACKQNQSHDTNFFKEANSTNHVSYPME